MWKVVGIAIGILFGTMALGIIGSYLGVVGNIATAPARVINKTLDTDNIINSYDWYFEQYGKIQTAKTVYDNNVSALQSFESAAGDRSKWSFDDKQEDARLRSMVQGAQNGYNGLVNEYNANAKEANHSIFMDHNNVPDHIDPVI